MGVPTGCGVGAQGREESLIAERGANGVQGQRATFVDPVVKHGVRPRIAHHDVARQSGHPAAVQHGQGVGSASAALLLPQPFGVAGKAFVQPEVLPTRHGEAVAEPLVGQLVGNQPVAAVLAVNVVAAKHRQAVRFEGNFQLVFGHDHRVRRKRVGAEAVGEELHHFGQTGEVTADSGGQWRRKVQAQRHRSSDQVSPSIAANEHRGEVAGHGFPHVEAVTGAARTARLGRQNTVRDHGVARFAGDRDAVGGFVTRMVVARKPRLRPAGLPRYEHAVVEFFPAHITPGAAQRMRRPAIPHRHLKLFPRLQSLSEGDHELARRMRNLGSAHIVHGNFFYAQPRKVEAEPVKGHKGAGRNNRDTVEPVSGYPVIQAQVVVLHRIPTVARRDQIGVIGAGRTIGWVHVRRHQLTIPRFGMP